VEQVEVLHGHTYRLRSELRPARTTLGEIVTWRLSVETPARWSGVDVVVTAPDSSLEIDTWVQPRTPTIGRERDVWRFERTVRAFDLGPRALPAAIALLSEGMRMDSLVFPPDTLFVDSLTAGPRAVVDPDRGPLPTDLRPIDRIVAAAGAVLLLLTAAAVVWLARRRWIRARSDAVPGPPPEPPVERYRRALDALRGEIGRLPRDAFYDRLSAAIRRYVEETTGVPAPERTTRELIEALRARNLAPAPAREAIASVLQRADLAKFARIEDETTAALAALDEARSLAERLEARGGSPPGDAGPGANRPEPGR
jgi:hypothetical protein